MVHIMFWSIRLAAAIFLLAGLAAPLGAQPGGTSSSGAQTKYPLSTVTLVTHSSPGGGSDVFLRELTKHLGPAMGVNFAVENVTGGSAAPADVARTARFLCGPGARYMTGQTLHVNGGAFLG